MWKTVRVENTAQEIAPEGRRQGQCGRISCEKQDQPGKDGSVGPRSCADHPLPSRWKMPSLDWA